MAEIARIDDLGGMVAAVEAGHPQAEIADAAYAFQREVERRRAPDRGRQRPRGSAGRGHRRSTAPTRRRRSARSQRVQRLRAERDAGAHRRALDRLRTRVRGRRERHAPPDRRGRGRRHHRRDVRRAAGSASAPTATRAAGRRPPELVLVVLDRLRVAQAGAAVGVEAELLAGAPLAQQVPVAVELDPDGLQALAVPGAAGSCSRRRCSSATRASMWSLTVRRPSFLLGRPAAGTLARRGRRRPRRDQLPRVLGVVAEGQVEPQREAPGGAWRSPWSDGRGVPVLDVARALHLGRDGDPRRCRAGVDPSTCSSSSAGRGRRRACGRSGRRGRAAR